MKFRYLKEIFTGLILLSGSLATVANAGIITIGALSGNDDGTTVISDTLNNREWLRWDKIKD